MKFKITKYALLATTLTALISSIALGRTDQPVYHGSNFSTVWKSINSQLYSTLPNYSIVSAIKLGTIGSALMNATLDNRNDFRPRRIKLVHPNGVCLAGKWEIDQSSEFSGYFSNNSKGLIIARASATQDFVNYKEYRAFGLAIKLFPTLDENQTVFTSNLFSVDNVPGILHQRYADTLMTNQIPDFNIFSEKLSSALRLTDRLPFLATFNYLSKQNDSGPENRNPLIRRTVEVARAGITREYSAIEDWNRLPRQKQLGKEQKIIEPVWVGFEVEEGTLRSNESDFRNEVIDLINMNQVLKYKILVANSKSASGKQNWTRVGTMTFNKVVASEPCDKELHFHHPRTDD